VTLLRRALVLILVLLILVLGATAPADAGLVARPQTGRGPSASTAAATKSRSWRWRGFGVTVEVPDQVGRAVAWFRPRRDRPTADPGGQPGQLILRDPPPVVVVKRDHERALDAVREFWRRPEGDGALAESSSCLNPSDPTSTVAREVARHAWYHTIELPGGLVTPGIYDQRPLVPHYGMPDDLRGRRVLDVATNDGFWAFEFERRGAEVIAVDVERGSDHDFPPVVRDALLRQGLDWLTGTGFDIAHRALRSKVKRVITSIYGLDPRTIGVFDLVHVGDVLVHLENPIAALRRVRSVTSGQALICDVVSADRAEQRANPHVIGYRGGWSAVTWWVPSVDTLAQMVIDAGFSDVKVHLIYSLAQTNKRTGPWHAVLKATP
jgi:tRNA (mo5U34)-methyltransferase